jgi:hypothetical protein
VKIKSNKTYYCMIVRSKQKNKNKIGQNHGRESNPLLAVTWENPLKQHSVQTWPVFDHWPKGVFRLKDTTVVRTYMLRSLVA